jgi:hypothetical protein
MFLHSDPPIRPAGDGTYVGKSGKTRSTEADYKSFLGWESALFTSWASMVYLALGVEMALGTQKSQIAKRRKGH